MTTNAQPPADDLARRRVYYQGPGLVPLADGTHILLDHDMACWTDPNDPSTLVVGRVALEEPGVQVIVTARQVYVVATDAR